MGVKRHKLKVKRVSQLVWRKQGQTEESISKQEVAKSL
jgi:hypothetical protein